MPTPRTGRPTGRPSTYAYGPMKVREGEALSERVAVALRTLTTEQAESIRALVEDVDCRLASIASIALGIGVGKGVYAARVRLAAHELLARCCGDLQLGPAPLHLHTSGGAGPKVVFVKPDEAAVTAVAEPQDDRQLALDFNDSSESGGI